MGLLTPAKPISIHDLDTAVEYRNRMLAKQEAIRALKNGTTVHVTLPYQGDTFNVSKCLTQEEIIVPLVDQLEHGIKMLAERLNDLGVNVGAPRS